MLTVHPQYITDNAGKKLAVVLPLDEFETMMEDLEELEYQHSIDLVRLQHLQQLHLQQLCLLQALLEQHLQQLYQLLELLELPEF